MTVKSVKKKVSMSIEVDEFLQKGAVLLWQWGCDSRVNARWRQRRLCGRCMRRESGLSSMVADATELRSWWSSSREVGARTAEAGS